MVDQVGVTVRVRSTIRSSESMVRCPLPIVAALLFSVRRLFSDPRYRSPAYNVTVLIRYTSSGACFNCSFQLCTQVLGDKLHKTLLFEMIFAICQAANIEPDRTGCLSCCSANNQNSLSVLGVQSFPSLAVRKSSVLQATSVC